MAAKVARKRRALKKDLVNPRVLSMAVDALRQNPDVGSKELMERAVAIDPSLKRADGRVFHMRYAMRARRILKAEERAANPGAAHLKRKRRGRPPAVASAPASPTRRSSSRNEMSRSIVQGILMETMTDALNAETKQDVAQLLRANEERAERILSALSGK